MKKKKDKEVKTMEKDNNENLKDQLLAMNNNDNDSNATQTPRLSTIHYHLPYLLISILLRYSYWLQ